MRKYESVNIGSVTVKIPYWNYGSSLTASSGRVCFVGEGVELEFEASSDEAEVIVHGYGGDLDSYATIYGWKDDGGMFISSLDITPWVEARVGGYLYLTFTVDGDETDAYAFRCYQGIEPLAGEVVTPPPYLPYHDELDVVEFPMVNNQTEYVSVYADDGQEEYECSTSNRLAQVSLNGGTSIRWNVGSESTLSHYSPARQLPNQCETANIGWIDRHGMRKSWVFERETITTEVPDPVEIITGRGIGNKRIGGGTVTVVGRCAGASRKLREWLSDIAITPNAWWYRRYLDDNANTSLEESPITIESAEVDLSENNADFEVTINLIKTR